MTVAEMLHRISSAELTEWIAYAKIEPFGELRNDLRAGVISATIATYAGKSLKDDAEVEPADFFHTLPGSKSLSNGPILLDDKEAQSELIKNAIFKVNRNG